MAEHDRSEQGKPTPASNLPAGDPSARNSEQQRMTFARVFAQHDRWLYAYLVTLLGNPADAEEVFQEVCVVLWKEYEAFDPTTNFAKWASVIAHNQVHRFRRTQQKHARHLPDTLIDLLAAEAVDHSELLEARRLALHGCLQKLSENDRQLIQSCYSDSRQSMKSVAEMLGKPSNTVYKAINRIRKALHLCIDRTLSLEGQH